MNKKGFASIWLLVLIVLVVVIIAGYFTSKPHVITPESTSPISITSPAGGETWSIGSTHLITWDKTTAPNGSQLNLILVNDVEGTENLASVANTGSYSWTIGANYIFQLHPSDYSYPLGTYRIRLEDLGVCTEGTSTNCLDWIGVSSPFGISWLGL